MLTLGLLLLLCPVCFAKTEPDLHRGDQIVFVMEGANVSITCYYQSDMAMHFSWYKHKVGQKPELIATIYKYEEKPIFYHEFKNTARFHMVNKMGKTHLEIKELQLSDSATYYCGSAHSNIVEFGEGTELIVKASQFNQLSVVQQPVKLVQPGDNVTLLCTVFTQTYEAEHRVYWFRHGLNESSPGIIYNNRDSSYQCKKNSEAGSTQSCDYSLPIMNLSLSDDGIYYCAVAVCGMILFGNGTTLEVNTKDVGCFEHLYILVHLSVLRTLVLLCCVAIIIVYVCISQRKNRAKTDFQLLSRKSDKKDNSICDKYRAS